MDNTILDRAAFLAERSDVPRALPPQNPAEQMLLAAMKEQQILSILLVNSLLQNQALNLNRLLCVPDYFEDSCFQSNTSASKNWNNF